MNDHIFEIRMISDHGMVSTNAHRLHEIGRLVHAKLSQFDSQQLKTLYRELPFGPGLCLLADIYGSMNHGLRRTFTQEAGGEDEVSGA